jgi:hypothetical protein
VGAVFSGFIGDVSDCAANVHPRGMTSVTLGENIDSDGAEYCGIEFFPHGFINGGGIDKMVTLDAFIEIILEFFVFEKLFKCGTQLAC